MAETFKHKSGHLVIKMSNQEAVKLGFDAVGIECVCKYDVFHKHSISGDAYYVASLNDVLCEKCLDSFTKRHPHFPNEVKYEKRMIALINKLLDNV